MVITGSTALVTGANRGIGRHFALQLLERGASKVYATARDPQKVDIPGAEVLQLDITDPASVAAAARVATDVDLLVLNAGVAHGQNVIDGDEALIRDEFDVHVFGNLSVLRAFAPVLGANGGGGIIGVHSALSWITMPGTGAYSAAKAAMWAVTNGARVELAGQGTHVLGLHLGLTDTDMAKEWDAPKGDPADVVRDALDGLQAGETEVLADETSRQVKAMLAHPPAAVLA